MLTDEQLTDLERLYTPADQQKCRICGGGMKFASSMDSLTKYVCGSPDAALSQNEFGLGMPGWRNALDHYTGSEWYDQHVADPRIVALIQEIRAARLPVQERMDLLQVDTAQEVLRSVLSTVYAATANDRFFVSRSELLRALGPLLQQWDVQGS